MMLRMQADTNKVWQRYGERDPFFGVLANARYRCDEMDADRRAEFYASGRNDVAELTARLDRLAPDRPRGTLVDFGCGVGRCLVALAQQYDGVIGVDVSEGMIAEAKKSLEENKIGNARFARSLDELTPPVDLIHSHYVLQHIDANHGRTLIARMWELLGPGGVLAVQFPITARRPLRAKLKEAVKRWLPSAVRAANLLRKGHADPPMHMHCYDLGAVAADLSVRGCAEIHLIRSDPDTEHLGMFLFARKDSAG